MGSSGNSQAQRRGDFEHAADIDYEFRERGDGLIRLIHEGQCARVAECIWNEERVLTGFTQICRFFRNLR